MKETTPTPLQIPEIALGIISHLDPPTILSIRLVSFPISTLILNHQKSISRSIAQRDFSTDTDWCLPDTDCLQKNFHLKTLTRLPKAVELARRANKNLECYADAGRVNTKGKRRAETTLLKPTSLYPAFLGRCASAFLIIWTLNDISRHVDQSEPLPIYTSKPSPLNHRERFGRLFSRITDFTSKPSSASPSPAEVNAQAISTYINTIVPRSESEVRSRLSKFDSVRKTYINSLSRDHRIDLVWVQQYLFIGLARGTRGQRGHYGASEDVGFALQQGPGLMLSLCSDDQRERDWAWGLAGKVVHARKSDLWIDEWERIIPFPPGEEGWGEEARRAKEALTKGDWRDRGGAVLGT